MDKPLFKLQAYEGPLDLLLDMIKNSKIDIFDIDIFEISEQYFLYLKTMEEMNMELTADFLVMAPQLLLIKSKMLLPTLREEEEEDPRRDLTWALLEYQKCKKHAEILADLKEAAGETFTKAPDALVFPKKYKENMPIESLANAYIRVWQRNARRMPPKPDSFAQIVKKEIYPVTDKLKEIGSRIKRHMKLDFKSLFSRVRTRSEIVATFLAVLELVSDKKVKVTGGEDLNFSIEASDEQAVDS